METIEINNQRFVVSESLIDHFHHSIIWPPSVIKTFDRLLGDAVFSNVIMTVLWTKFEFCVIYTFTWLWFRLQHQQIIRHFGIRVSSVQGQSNAILAHGIWSHQESSPIPNVLFEYVMVIITVVRDTHGVARMRGLTERGTKENQIYNFSTYFKF